MRALTLDSNTTLVVRPIRPADRFALAAAFDRLSRDSRRQRFLGPKRELSARELAYLTEVDHITHEALVAIDDQGDLVAVARYAAWPEGSIDSAEIAFVVSDSWHRRGIGSALVADVIERARANGFTHLTASTLGDNTAARSLLVRLGFRVAGAADGIVSHRLALAEQVRQVQLCA